MNSGSSGTWFLAGVVLVFVLMMTGMIVQAVKDKDPKNRVRIIARIIGVTVMVVGFIIVWLKS